MTYIGTIFQISSFIMRKGNRDNLSLRKIEIIPNFIKNSEGSCLVRFGETQVVCTASVDAKVPRWLLGSRSEEHTSELQSH